MIATFQIAANGPRYSDWWLLLLIPGIPLFVAFVFWLAWVWAGGDMPWERP